MSDTSQPLDHPATRSTVEGNFQSSEGNPADVWIVRFGNYEPAEVLAIYNNEAAAREHAEANDEDPLEVQRWRPFGSYQEWLNA